MSCGFNNVLKKVMPKKLNDFDHNTNKICRHKSFCDGKSYSGNEKKNSVLVKETTFFVFKIVNLNNNYANVDSFKYILQSSKECSL